MLSIRASRQPSARCSFSRGSIRRCSCTTPVTMSLKNGWAACVVKGAVHFLTETVQRELGDDGVNVGLGQIHLIERLHRRQSGGASRRHRPLLLFRFHRHYSSPLSITLARRMPCIANVNFQNPVTVDYARTQPRNPGATGWASPLRSSHENKRVGAAAPTRTMLIEAFAPIICLVEIQRREDVSAPRRAIWSRFQSAPRTHGRRPGPWRRLPARRAPRPVQGSLPSGYHFLQENALLIAMSMSARADSPATMS